MSKRGCFCIAVLLLAIGSGTASADMVILKSGEMFQTSRAWKENGVVNYYKDGRIVRVAEQDVERLIQLQTPVEKKVPPGPPSAARPSSSPGQESPDKRIESRPPDAENAGYRGLQWGQRSEQIDGLVFVATDPAYGGVRQYSQPQSKKRFGRARVDNIFYGFWQDRLYTILIEVSSYLDFMDLKAEAFRRFGARGPHGDKPETFRWQAAGSDRQLAYDHQSDTGYLWMRSRMLHAKVTRRYPE